MPEFIDLGISNDSKAEEMEYKTPRKQFPCFYITSESPIELGEAGTAEIRYKLVERTEKMRNDKEEYRYELEVHGIAPISEEDTEDTEKPMKPVKRGLTQSFGDALEKARKGRDSYEE